MSTTVSAGRPAGAAAAARAGRAFRLRPGALASHVVLILVAVLVIAPLWWMVATSFKTKADMFALGNAFWPPSPTLESYQHVFNKVPMGRWLVNSLVVSGLQTFGTVVVAVLAAYAFARFRFPGRDAVFFAFLATIMIPMHTIMVPSYVILAFFDWLNTYQGLIVPHLASAFGVFLLRQFFLSLPPDLADAAQIDGANHVQILRHVYLPLSVPALTALAAIAFVQAWNDYYWPLLVVTDNQMRTLPLAIVWFRDAESGVEFGPSMAAASLASLPALLLYLALQRYFVEGAATSGLKG